MVHKVGRKIFQVFLPITNYCFVRFDVIRTRKFILFVCLFRKFGLFCLRKQNEKTRNVGTGSKNLK